MTTCCPTVSVCPINDYGYSAFTASTPTPTACCPTVAVCPVNDYGYTAIPLVTG